MAEPTRKRLTATQRTALREIMDLGGAVDAKHWSTYRGRWEQPRAIPPFARKYWRFDSSFLPTEVYPEIVYQAFASNPTARAVVAIANWSEAEHALEESQDE